MCIECYGFEKEDVPGYEIVLLVVRSEKGHF